MNKLLFAGVFDATTYQATRPDNLSAVELGKVIDDRVKAIMDRDGVNYVQAFQKLRDNRPDLIQEYSTKRDE